MNFFNKLMLVSLSFLYLTSLPANVYVELQEAYDDVKDLLSAPLYYIDQIEYDIKRTEDFLKKSKVTSFMIGVENGMYISYFKDCKIPMVWDGELKFISRHKGYVSIHTGTDEAKYECHKQLPQILRAAKEQMQKEIKENYESAIL